MDGDELFATVEEYAALGDHRTGTPTDAATIDWFADNLRRRDGNVMVIPFGFERYAATWSVVIEDVEVESLPVFYSAVGAVHTERPATGRVHVSGAKRGDGLEALVDAATADGRPAALATTVGANRMAALNRAVTAPGSVPVLIVGPEHDLDAAIANGELDVSIDAECVPGRSANVVATFGGATTAAPGLVLATPLSGWFRCASERGSGIAVLLALVERLAPRRPLTVVGTSGHELEGEGLHRLIVDGRLDALATADAIIHLGASIAARSPTGGRSPGVVRHTPSAADADIRAALEPLGRPVQTVSAERATDPASWIGEARHWCRFGVPVLSLTGGSPVFHTAADIPDATSPALLEHARDAVSDAVTALSAGVRR